MRFFQLFFTALVASVVAEGNYYSFHDSALSKSKAGIFQEDRISHILFQYFLFFFLILEFPRAIMVTGSNFLDCQGVYYITYDTIVDETSTEEPTSNRPVYQSINGDRYIYYRSDQGNLLRSIDKKTVRREGISIYLLMFSFQ